VLFQDNTLWKSKQKNGFEIIKARFNLKEHQEVFLVKIAETITNLNRHRLNNFTGTMLQHHSLQSTKFMSRWIEEKNKT